MYNLVAIRAEDTQKGQIHKSFLLDMSVYASFMNYCHMKALICSN